MRADRRGLLCLAFLGAAFTYHLYHALQGWNRPIADFNPWRQSQTALTAWYFLRDGFSLAYPLPVLGPPWSIPFEFPTYQGLVALLASLTGFPLESCGRAVSLIAFYASLPAVNLLLRERFAMGSERFFVLGFLLLSPLYVAWSRAFSIESTALALSVWYLAAFHRWALRPSIGRGTWLLGLGVLAGLTKITTLFIFSAAAVAILVTTLGARPSMWRERARFVVATVILAFVLPLATTLVWVAYTDAIKASGPLTATLTSSALADWNYGSLAQRLSPATWRQFEHFAENLVVSRYTLLLAALSLALYPENGRRVLLLTGLFVLPLLVFTNLYVAHDYYWCANGFLVLVALGMAFAPLVSRPSVPLAAGVIACVLVFYQYRNTYNGWYGPTQRQAVSPLLPLAGKIQELTQPERYSVVYGAYWDPLLAYHSQRRMIMTTMAHPQTPLEAPPMSAAIAGAGRDNLGTLVFVGPIREDTGFVNAQLRTLGIRSGPAYADAFGTVYLIPSL